MYNQKPLLGTLPNYAHPLTPNVAAWVMNEGSGNKIFDIINSNHGTFGAGAAAPSWAPEGLDFDGGDYVNLTGFTGAGTTHTIAFRIYSRDSTSAGKYFFDIQTGRLLFAWGSDQAGDIGVWDGSGTWKDFASSPSANTWHDLIFLLNSSNNKMDLYLDGIHYGNQKSYTPRAIGGNVTIGSRYSMDGFYFEGMTAHVYIYDYILSPFQISQLHYNPYSWLAQPMEAELMYAAPPVGAIINQFQKANLGADLYDGVLIT